MEVVAHLATLDLVPPLNKVLHNIENNGTINCHVHLPRMSASAKRKSYLLANIRRATACGEFPARKSFRSRNCSHLGSPRRARCCSPGLERGFARSPSGVRRQVGDSGCPSDQSKCQGRQYTRGDYRQQRLFRGGTKTRHHLPDQRVSQVEKKIRTFRPNMVRVTHARDVRMEGLKGFLRRRC